MIKELKMRSNSNSAVGTIIIIITTRQTYCSGCLTPEKEFLTPIGYGAGWAQELV
jgi:hypothetical protein